MSWRPFVAALLVAPSALLSGCAHRHKVLPAPPPLRYVLEPAWQGGVWFYPRESFAFDQTGIAGVVPPGHARLTTDNEPYDPNAAAAAMQAVQLPAIATVTNLDNGRQMLVRINDRGPPSPKRLIAVTPRVAALLGLDAAGARVRVKFDAELTAALSRQVQGRAADLAINIAPRGSVQQTDLAPLTGTGQEAARAVRGPAAIAQVREAAATVVPPRLSEAVIAGAPQPGVLMIDAGDFGSERYARERAAQIEDVGAAVVRSRTGGVTTYSVRAGPYASIAEADDALDRIVRDGIGDARIVVDLQY